MCPRNCPFEALVHGLLWMPRNLRLHFCTVWEGSPPSERTLGRKSIHCRWAMRNFTVAVSEFSRGPRGVVHSPPKQLLGNRYLSQEEAPAGVQRRKERKVGLFCSAPSCLHTSAQAVGLVSLSSSWVPALPGIRNTGLSCPFTLKNIRASWGY